MKKFYNLSTVISRPSRTTKSGFYTGRHLLQQRNYLLGSASDQLAKPKVVEEQRNDFAGKTPEFDNPRVIYRSKKTGELLRAYAIFTACSFDVLVDNQVKLLRWTRRLLGARCFSWLLKKTLAGQFMAGMAEEELVSQARRHAQTGIFPMFAYTASEIHGGATNPDSAKATGMSQKEMWFQTNLAEVSRSIQVAAKCKDLSPTKPLVSTKITFMTQAELLRSLSSVIVGQSEILLKSLTDVTKGQQFKEDVCGFIAEKIAEGQSVGELHGVNLPKGDILTNLPSLLSSTSFHVALNQSSDRLETLTNTKCQKLSAEEITAIVRLWHKMKQLNVLTVSSDIQLNYDAEQTYIQPAIESLVLDSMRESNREYPHILNTYQCYLKRTHSVVKRDIEIAKREGFCFGGKFVRGAYIDEETLLSKEQGYENPVNDSYDATTVMYSSVALTALDYCKGLPQGKTRLVFATHNKDTVAFVINQLKSRGMDPVQYGVSFAQLLGMRDFISFALGEAGYPAGKLIHYAETESGVAYLSRRLTENRSGLPSPLIERRLLLNELKNRMSLSR